MDLNKFIADIAQKGVAKASTANVLITWKNGDALAEYDMTMRIEATDFPGRSLSLTQSNYAGVPYNIVTGGTFAEIPLSIILSEDLREKEYLERWQDAAVGKYRKEEITGSSFNLGFYNDYIGTVEITQYNDVDEPVYRSKLIDAFPAGVGVVSTSWESGDQILKLPVSFTYRYYKVEDINR